MKIIQSKTYIIACDKNKATHWCNLNEMVKVTLLNNSQLNSTD